MNLGDPLLVINPPMDSDFVGACHAAMDDRPGPPEALEAILRRRFPRAVVRARALSGETITVWYVYRDGHWVSSP